MGATLATHAVDPELGSVLARAVTLRFPDIRGLHGREKVEKLTDHIVATAIMRGDLEELRLEAQTKLLEASQALGRVAAIGKNRQALDEARRRVRPELGEQFDRAKWVIERATEQINRMGGSDYDAASRAYTLLAGS